MRLVIFLVTAVLASSCVSKPFQPPPPMFKMFSKLGSSEEDVKRELLSCGFPNVISGASPNESNNSVAVHEVCMFRKGFLYIDGYKGLCSTQIANNLSSCREY